MKIFELLKKYLRLLGCTCQSSNLYEKLVGIAVNGAILGVSLISFLTTLWFFAFDAETFPEYSESLFYVLCSLLLVVWYAILVWQKHEYRSLFDKLDEIIETRSSNTVLNTIYRKTINKIEQLSEMVHFVVMHVQIPFYIVSNIVMSTYEYISSDYSNESFRLMYPAAYPFDWKTPAGYLASCCIQISAIVSSGALHICTLILTVGVCLFAIDFVCDIEENLRQLNDYLITTKDQDLTGKERLNVKKRLTDIMIFHSEAKEFTNKFGRINQGIICSFLIFTFVSICSLMLQINMLLSNGDFIGILQVSVPVSIIIFWLSLFCYFGDRMTQRFEEVADKLYQIQWYRLSSAEQKYLIVAIAVAQKGAHLQGFGSISCTCAVFYQIINTTFSYFLVLREFA